MTVYRVVEACEVVSVARAAKLLGVQPNTVRLWVANGTIQTARVFGSTTQRIPRAEVIRLLREEIADARMVRKLRS